MTTGSMSTFDFFDVGALPTPAVNAEAAREIARTRFGLEVDAHPMGSQQDANFLLGDPAEPVGVLKVTNAAWGEADVAAQEDAARHLAGRLPDLRLPLSRTGVSGGTVETVELQDGRPALARVGAHLGGGTLHGSDHLDARTVAALGALAGRVSTALADFDHPALGHVLQWDLQHADRVVELLAEHVADPARRRQLLDRTRAEWATLSAVADSLPRQAIHGDLTDDNVILAPSSAGSDRRLDGVIDLGDLTRSWAVAELAVTVSSLLHHDGADVRSVLPAVVAFDAERPLSDDEIRALWPLVVLRGAVLVVSGHHQVAVDDSNAYASGALDREWQVFATAASVPSVVMETVVREALGRRAPRAAPPVGRALADGATPRVLDLSPDADDLGSGRWLEPGIEDRLALAALDDGAECVVTRFGEARLTLAALLQDQAPATVATGVDAWWAADTDLRAPWAGTVEAAGGGLRLVADGMVLELGCQPSSDVRDGSPVAAGATLARVPARQRVRVTALATVGAAGAAADDVPAAVQPALFGAWRSVVADPSALLGVAADTAYDTDAHALLARRTASFATVQEHFYADPPHIERGWREYLVDEDAWPLLDMVNNVAILGHGHPAVAEAVDRQWLRLNTNSRFHYESVVDFSERLAGMLPDPLDTVFLVNSGSEANDLALRIAMAASGRTDLLALKEAYHGWTYLTDAVSTSLADNPNALATRPDFIHTVDAPNPYRGVHRGADAHLYATEAVARIDELAAAGHAPAAFISETYYGNAGGMPLPQGYLSAVYAAIRRHGGLAVADEVQVGYARLGEWFWGFEEQGAVPDIVTVAKAMGNGHPLGAVITSRAVAEAYRHGGYFFSSAGGSPVSSVVGMTVLDVMESEGLQENARAIGAYFREALEELATRHPIIGAVHGSGLYMGVELVRDRETLEPAVEETAAICDRMRELGVIVQPTSDRMCVLKVKPPLVLTRAAAEFFVATLDRVLTHGW